MLLIYLIFPMVLLPGILNDPALTPLDLKLYYNAETAYKIIASYGDELRLRYVIGILSVDVLYPLYYSCFLFSILLYLFKQQGIAVNQVVSQKIGILLLPYMAMTFDLIENSLNAIIVAFYPKKMPLIASVAGVATSAKWLAVFVVLVVLVCILVSTVKRNRA